MQVTDAGCGGIIRIIGKHIKYAAPKDLFTLCHGRLKIRIANSDNCEIGKQNQIQSRSRLKESAKIRSYNRFFHYVVPCFVKKGKGISLVNVSPSSLPENRTLHG